MEQQIKSYEQMCTEAAQNYYNLGQYDFAYKDLQPILKDDLKYFEAWYLLGKIYLKQKKLKEAEDAFNKAIQVNKRKMGPYVRLMQIYTTQGLFDQAEQRRIIAEKVLQDLGDQCTEKDQMDYYVFTMDLKKRDKKYEETIQCCDKLLSLNYDKKISARYNKIDCLIHLSKFEEAKEELKIFKKEVRNDSKNKPKYYNLEFAYLRYTGQYEEALEKAEGDEYENIFADQLHFNLIYLQVAAHFYKQDYKAVIEKAKDIIKTADSPKNDDKTMKKTHGPLGWPILFYVACAYKSLGDAENYNKYMTLTRKNLKVESEDFYLEDARTCFANKDNENAIQNIQKALRLRPNFVPALTLKIAILRSLGDIEEADKILKNKNNQDNIEEYLDKLGNIEKGAEFTSESVSLCFDDLGNEKVGISIKTTSTGPTGPTTGPSNPPQALLPLISWAMPKSEKSEEEVKILKKIETGGFGLVQIEQRKDKINAVKYIKNADQETKDKIINEVRNNMKCAHKNIVAIEGFSSLANPPYIVMEYCDGGDLYNLIEKRYKELTLENKIYLSYSIACGLEYIHSEGLIHSDLKTRNVLLKKEDPKSDEIQKLIPKICDFGLTVNTKIDEVADEEGHFSFTGFTPNYMAPEMLTEKNTDYKDDIYSFGLIMMTIFSGKEPFKGLNNAMIMQKLREKDLPDPENEIQDPAVDNDIKDLIADCLKEREERPEMEEVVKKLNEIYTKNGLK